jgi:antirestriction protein ArdC
MKNTHVEQKDMYQIITNRIISELEKGNLFWQKTWNGYGLARNYVTGQTYKGINMLMMNFVYKHTKPYFLTFLQAKNLGGKIKKGAKACEVIYYNVQFKDENKQTISANEAAQLKQADKKVSINKFLKYYSVFNVDDIEGIDFKFDDVQLNDNEKIQVCENIIENYPNKPTYEFKDTNRAFYAPSRDKVNMPPYRIFYKYRRILQHLFSRNHTQYRTHKKIE